MIPSIKKIANSTRCCQILMASITIMLFITTSVLVYLEPNQLPFKSTFLNANIIISTFGIIMVIAWARILESTIFRPINKLKIYFNQISSGKSEVTKLEISNKEVGEVAMYAEKLSESNRKTAEFALEMGKGNFNYEFIPLSNDDVLGNALLEMRKNMLNVIEDEKKRHWINEGMTKFGELLRINTQEIHKFSENILINLIKYIEANQGAFYVLEKEFDDEEAYLTMTACYAWGRKKTH